MNAPAALLARMHCGGIVLCGGQSTRMGQAKAWLPCGDETLLTRTTRTLGEVVSPVVVVAAPGQVLPSHSANILVARDAHEGRGPLEGMLAGMKALDGLVDIAYVASCDVPLLRAAFVRRVIELLGDHQIAVPHADGFHHWLAAAYRLDVVPSIERLLAADRLQAGFLAEHCRVREIHADELRAADAELASLQNCNTPEEYSAALASMDNLLPVRERK